MFEYSQLWQVLILDLHFAIPTQILNTESLGMTSYLMRRADKRKTTMTETNYADHNVKTQNGEQWRKIRVQEGCREKKGKEIVEHKNKNGKKLSKKIPKLERNVDNQRMNLEQKRIGVIKQS